PKPVTTTDKDFGGADPAVDVPRVKPSPRPYTPTTIDPINKPDDRPSPVPVPAPPPPKPAAPRRWGTSIVVLMLASVLGFAAFQAVKHYNVQSAKTPDPTPPGPGPGPGPGPVPPGPGPGQDKSTEEADLAKKRAEDEARINQAFEAQ